MVFNKKTDDPQVVTQKPKKFSTKNIAVGLGVLFGVAHIGVLGHLLNAVRPPVINFPQGDYSSYTVEATRDGYKIEYRANDPKVLGSDRSIILNQNNKGLFGGRTEQRLETRRDEYTMDGARNIGGAVDGEGKSAKDIECIVADAGARSQGAMAGTSIAAGVLVPAVINVPYIGWLAAGWMTLLGQRVGSNLGSQVGKVFNEC
jgi:hypothetical protein